MALAGQVAPTGLDPMQWEAVDLLILNHTEDMAPGHQVLEPAPDMLLSTATGLQVMEQILALVSQVVLEPMEDGDSLISDWDLV